MKALAEYINEKLVLNKDTFKDIDKYKSEFISLNYSAYSNKLRSYNIYIDATIDELNKLFGESPYKNKQGKPEYIWCLEYNDIVFIIQPALGGKPKGKDKKGTFKLFTEYRLDANYIVKILKDKGLDVKV